MKRRLFVAVCPPAAVLGAIEEVTGPARKVIVGPRWTTPDQWHVTLQFLGGVDEERFGEVQRALEGVSVVQPFPVRLGGGGAFPKEGRARVVWLGVQAGGDALGALAERVGRALTPLGFEPEARAYHPHVTLARLKVPGDVGAVVETIGAEAVGPAFTVEEVVLYESRTRREGASYDAVTRVGLVG